MFVRVLTVTMSEKHALLGLATPLPTPIKITLFCLCHFGVDMFYFHQLIERIQIIIERWRFWVNLHHKRWRKTN